MKILSLNIGMPDEVMWQGSSIMTGIFKAPVTGPVMLRRLNLDGDGQADLTVHGGESKAVYAYPAEHYRAWANELPGMNLPCGAFGENFTTEGLIEDAIHIGDRFRIGEAELIVTEPRMPCYKLMIRFHRTDMVKRFIASRRTGLYFAVLREGVVEAGDTITPLSQNRSGITIADIVRLYAFDKGDLPMLRRAAQTEALPIRWRRYFQHRIERLSG